jgi:hypothetical protein
MQKSSTFPNNKDREKRIENAQEEERNQNTHALQQLSVK